ncbi:MAG: hypothetical protein K5798_10300 [Nitrosopumilus sp.]|uniref:hypothetical protein n=1 Tax=Nitrosopumilus sp. TaxID=2024843 RepID=UPI00242AD3BA|nr:hypothetical protein [Nitrosopumilus sp.]MCV0367635.1 hypothetical protein [Nitrosopumilus sp.]
MKTMLLIIFTLVLFSLSFMMNDSDALIVAYSLDDLAEEAEFVVIGKVIEVSPLVPGYLLSFTDGYDRFQFDVTLAVENDLDGTYGKDAIVFRIHDSREEFGIGIEDEQHFEVGERVLVFIGEKEPDSVMGDAYLVQGVTQGKFLLQDGIAYGTTYGDDFPEGISEEELILKIKNIRSVLSSNGDFIDEQVGGGGSIDLDSELSTTYALDFVGGLFYHTILPLTALSVGITALFLVPYFILKRKNIPSKPYLSLILAGLLLYFVMPYIFSSLQTLTIIFSQPEQIRTWVFDLRFILLLIPFVVLSIAGILLYRSLVIRKLIRK